MIRWLRQSLQACLNTAFGCCLLLGGFAPELAAAEVVIVDSNKHSESFALAQAVSRHCPQCGTIQYMDMQRDIAVGRLVIADLKAREEKGNLDLVIALGPMATRITAQDLQRTPVFYLMRERPTRDLPGTDRVKALTANPPAGLQLAAFKALVPGMRRIGLLLRRSTAAPVYDELVAAAADLGVGLSFFYVDRPEDVSPGLRQAIGETDGLLFLRDSMVINGDTIRFILRLTLENRVPTFTYSSDLVAMGMGASLHVDREKLARYIGAVVDARLSGKQSPPDPTQPFVVEVNPAALGDKLLPVTHILGMEVIKR